MKTLAFIPELSRCFPSLHTGFLIGLLVLLALAGPLLHAYLPVHQMWVDEQVKDQTISAAEARRQVNFLRSAATIAMGLGMLQMIGILCDLAGRF